MKKDPRVIPLEKLRLNEGQLKWLPKNPRTWTQTDLDKTAKSLEEDPDFLQDRPVLVVEGVEADTFIVFAGNLRTMAAQQLEWSEVPAVVYHPTNKAERLVVKRRAMKDNGSFGLWDYDELANSWDDMPLADWGVPAWKTDSGTDSIRKKMEEEGLSTEGMTGDEEYEAFKKKFKQALTTDDCYTPAPVYTVVRDFVDQHVFPLKGRKVVRPFFPGGNYEDLSQYPDNAVVIDNPPFSLLSKIIRFYCENDIPFFIFAPSLTLFSAPDCDVSYIVADANIVYENGAKIRTGFITNLLVLVRIWVCPELHDKIDEAQQQEDKTKQGFIYPDNIVTSATLGKLAAHGTEFVVRKRSCEYIRESDSAKTQDRRLYGGGFIMSDSAAAERAAAERAPVTRLNISPREREIIERLNKQDNETDNRNPTT